MTFCPFTRKERKWLSFQLANRLFFSHLPFCKRVISDFWFSTSLNEIPSCCNRSSNFFINCSLVPGLCSEYFSYSNMLTKYKKLWKILQLERNGGFLMLLSIYKHSNDVIKCGDKPWLHECPQFPFKYKLTAMLIGTRHIEIISEMCQPNKLL